VFAIVASDVRVEKAVVTGSALANGDHASPTGQEWIWIQMDPRFEACQSVYFLGGMYDAIDLGILTTPQSPTTFASSIKLVSLRILGKGLTAITAETCYLKV